MKIACFKNQNNGISIVAPGEWGICNKKRIIKKEILSLEEPTEDQQELLSDDDLLTNAAIEWLIKDAVPLGVKYWLFDDIELPDTREYRDAWEIDETIEHSGVGL